MSVSQGGGSVGLVVPPIGFIADPDEAMIDQSHGTRDHPSAREPRPGEIGSDQLANAPDTPGETCQILEFLQVAVGIPFRVVEVLLALLRVQTGAENVGTPVRADPYLLPGRGNHQRFAPGDFLGVDQPRPIDLQVAEPATPSTPRVAWFVEVGVVDVGNCRRRISRHDRAVS